MVPKSVISMDLSAVAYNQRQIQCVISDINEPLAALDCLQEISDGSFRANCAAAIRIKWSKDSG